MDKRLPFTLPVSTSAAVHRAAIQMGYARAQDVPAYHAGELAARATMIRGRA